MSNAALEAMVGEMEKLLGLGESPAGSNRNKVTSWYGLVGPWCDMSITYAAFHSGNEKYVTYGGKYAYTVAHVNAFKVHGQWHNGIAGIRRGDIVFFNWHDGGDSIDHVGIVTGTSADGRTVYTIEGNIGNVCARKVRYSDTIAGYGRPAYPASSGHTEAPTKDPGPKTSGNPSGSDYAPFPGTPYFKSSPNSSLITRMGKRLVAEGCGKYRVGPGPQWTDTDKASYAAWQRKCGYSGADADGWPGKTSWDKLRVPR